MPRTEPSQDSVDAHLARWSSWADLSLDVEVEGMITRLQRINRHLQKACEAAATREGLDWQDYSTLHALMVRDSPGHATAGELAGDPHVAPATMTARIDRLARAGYATRLPSEDDRRVVHVQVSPEGFDRWKRVMAAIGRVEADLFVGMPTSDRRQLSDLLRTVLLRAEAGEADAAG
ncbi:MAG: MarR family winged helix-turn-helix transcriptional regulator [Nocardioides sp.]|uniref:MarR family winged helix-turn-helix transcriptional regulator n=1 Tax=Nocardioides sp. TaxID=35761 RepID=UPI003EFFBE6D